MDNGHPKIEYQMNMRPATILLGIVLALSTPWGFAQSVSLQTCLDSASANMPLLKQRTIQQDMLEAKLKSYGTALLPAISLNGQVSYQSAVPELPFSIPGSPGLEIPKGQYRTYAELYQPLFDGGISKALKSAEQAKYEANLQGLKAGEHSYRKQVAQLYFQLLLMDKQITILSKTIQLLAEREGVLKNALQNGVIQQNDLLKLQGEKIAQEKKLQELQAARLSGGDVMELLTGISLKNRELVLPNTETSSSKSVDQHPELKLIVAQQTSLSAGESLIGAQRMPRIGVFGQGGVGSPNPYNFFEKDLSSYYIVGLRLKWTIYDWGKASQDRRNIQLTNQLLSRQYEQKSIELQSNLVQLHAKSEQASRSLIKDDEILLIRTTIRQNAAVQLDQGVITNSDYLEEILAEQLAELTKSMDQIQLHQYQTLIRFELGTI